MVDSIRPTHPSIPSGSTTRRDQSTHSVESHTDDKQHQQPQQVKPVKERRRQEDRRKNKSPNWPFYEMRSGKDRRKNDGDHPSIEIDV